MTRVAGYDNDRADQASCRAPNRETGAAGPRHNLTTRHAEIGRDSLAVHLQANPVTLCGGQGGSLVAASEQIRRSAKGAGVARAPEHVTA